MAGKVKSIADTLGEGYADTLSTYGEKSQASDNLKTLQNAFKSFMLQSLYTAADKGRYSGGDAQNILGNIPINLGADLGGGYGLGLGLNTPSPMGDMRDDYRLTFRKSFEEGGLVSETPTKEYKEHLKSREGFLGYGVDEKSVIYKDSLGFDTGGTGHLMTDADKKSYGIDKDTKYVDYKVGDLTYQIATDKDGNIITLDKTVTDDWLEDDSTEHYKAGQSWAKELGMSEDQDMVNALSGVNFQFPAFKSKMENAWKAIKGGKIEEAVNQIKFKSGKPGTAISDWYDQSPKRVEDLVAALRKYGKKKK